ncbi:hypothetical protein [Nocardia altamirensis]|uniref:hypothetical protein n=1 Tax=Nocardia altamirensis TaxID=472158 RepID=UPI00114CEAC7|nr:hypothetical protein [Nocardia altamirensis]
MIAPAEWRGMAAAARSAAATLDVGAAEQARNAFDQHVRASAGLQSVKDQMRLLQPDPQSFADALVATAVAFEDFADLVARTRNRILDIAAAATGRIAEASAAADDERGAGDAAEPAAATAGIVAAARAEVRDVVRGALSAIGPVGLPTLDLVSDTLGQPGPWDDRKSLFGPGTQAADRPPSAVSPNDEVSQQSDPRGSIESGPSLTSSNGEARDRITAPAVFGPWMVDGQPSERTPVGAPPAVPVQSTGPAGVPEVGAARAEASVDRGAAPVDHPVAGDPEAAATSRSTGGVPESRAAERNTETPGPGDQDDTTSVQPTVGPAPAAGIAAGAVPIAAVLPLLPQSGSPASPGSATAASVSVGPADRPGRLPAPLADQRAPSVDPRALGANVTADANTPGSGARGPQSKVPPTQRDPLPPGAADGSDTMRDAVAAAMAAAAAPTFMVGERVDGDLQLARTLLADVLAVSEPIAPWLRWAVAVLRHSGGVSACVTSNEGRGWIPAGIFLPNAVSTPWVWALADDSAWEAVADPARILAEFGLAWRRKFGGRLTALASSAPVEERLLEQLPGVSVVSPVPAATVSTLAEPGSDLRDRLGVVGSRQLQDRAAAVPPELIGARVFTLAKDAHIRVGRAAADQTESLGAPALRARILRTIQKGVSVPEEWWAELRDVDDLLAASVLAGQVDVTGVLLGELRSERAGLSESGTSAPRDLIFERRCNELVLLSANAANRQHMRDAVYAHAQILGHPLFVDTAESASEANGRRPRRVISTRRER